jgi:hypothetical protein
VAQPFPAMFNGCRTIKSWLRYGEALTAWKIDEENLVEATMLKKRQRCVLRHHQQMSLIRIGIAEVRN